MAVLGTAREIFYQALDIARNVLEQRKANNERLANKRAKNAPRLQGTSNILVGNTKNGGDLESSEVPWLRYMHVFNSQVNSQ
jgi:hypothetical protein